MKKTVIILPLLATCTIASAQLAGPLPGRPCHSPAAARMSRVVSHLRQLDAASAGAMKPTGASQRLRATVDSVDAGAGLERFDSGVFRYINAAHGSSFDRYDLVYRPYTANPFQGQGIVDFDTAYFEYDFSNTKDTVVVKRNAAGKVLKLYSRSQETSYTLNPQQQPVLEVTREFNTATQQWVNLQRVSYTYDQQGRLVADTTESWSQGSNSYFYSYAAAYAYGAGQKPVQYQSANWSGSTWEPDSKMTVTYDAAGNWVKTAYDTWDGAAFQPYLKDTLAYGVNNGMMLHETFLNDGGSWLLLERERRELNASGSPTLVRTETLDLVTLTWDSSRKVLAYNSFDNPVRISYIDGTTGSALQTVTLYYENYEAARVEVLQTYQMLIPYPNPAGNTATVRLPANTDYHGYLTDIAGKVVAQWNIAANPDKALTLPLEELCAGTYLLQLADKTGNVYCGRLIKQ